MITRIELDLTRYKALGQQLLNSAKVEAKKVVVIIFDHQNKVLALANDVQQGVKDKEAAYRAIERLNMALDNDLKIVQNQINNAAADALKQASRDILDFIVMAGSQLIKVL